MKTTSNLFTGFTILVVTLLCLNACQKSDQNDGGANTPAAVPVQSCNVPGNSTCNPGAYQQIAPQMLSYQWSYTDGFCSCQTGYRPVMNSLWGISCAPAFWFPNSPYYGFPYQQVAYPTQNNQWTAIPQVTVAPVGTGNNCFSTAASVCDVRVIGSCGSTGGFCRPSESGSFLGFCSY